MSYDPAILAERGNVSDICDTVVRIPSGIETWKNLSLDEANKMLQIGFTSHRLTTDRYGNTIIRTEFNEEIHDWKLTGGESVIATVKDNQGEFMYHIESTSSWWRSTYHEVMLDTLLARYHKALVREPEFLFPSGSVERVMLWINSGTFRYLKPSTTGNHHESRIICFALSCTPVEQRQLNDVMKQFEYEYEFVTRYIASTANSIVTRGVRELPLLPSHQGGRKVAEYIQTIYDKIDAGIPSNMNVVKFVDAEVRKHPTYPSFVHKIYSIIHTDEIIASLQKLSI